MKRICLLVLLVTLLGVRSRPVFTQTSAELLNTSRTTENITTESMGYDRKNYSPLKRLVPIWNSSLMNDLGELAAPVVYNGVMYVINGKWTFAIDVETGRQIWRTPVEVEPGITRAATNRGAPAVYEGKIFRVTIDNHILALDMKTGKQIWNQKFAEAKEGYYATSAPIVANGVLISGMAGGESTTRGFLDGWDPSTGKKLWRRYTIPAPGEPGSETWPKNTDAVRMIRIWISFTGEQGTQSPTTPGPARVSIVCSRRVCSRSVRKRETWPATFNTRPTTCMTSMVRMKTFSPISRSAGSCGR